MHIRFSLHASSNLVVEGRSIAVEFWSCAACLAACLPSQKQGKIPTPLVFVSSIAIATGSWVGGPGA
jgi:hypothetical protein